MLPATREFPFQRSTTIANAMRAIWQTKFQTTRSGLSKPPAVRKNTGRQCCPDWKPAQRCAWKRLSKACRSKTDAKRFGAAISRVKQTTVGQCAARDHECLLSGKQTWFPHKVPVIGFLGASSAEVCASRLGSFRRGLSETGHSAHNVQNHKSRSGQLTPARDASTVISMAC